MRKNGGGEAKGLLCAQAYSFGSETRPSVKERKKKTKMKTIQDFYDKYGTGKNYEDLFAMMCHAKKASNPALAYDVENFIRDLKTVCENDFDELLWRDYRFIINYK